MIEISLLVSIIFSGLLIITILLSILKRTARSKDFSNISIRLKTWWAMFIVYCAATLFHPAVGLLAVMALCYFALKDYFSMIKSKKSDRRVFLWSYLTIPIQFYWIFIGWYGMYIVFIPVYVFLFLPLTRIIGKGTSGFLRSVSLTQWGLMLMVFGLSHLAYFQFATPEYGADLVLFLIILTQLNDVLHYFISLFIKGRKIVPSANPYITWEGFVGALLITTACSVFIYPYLTPFDVSFGIYSGVIIGVAGFVGSLTISVLKRDLLIGDKEKLEKINYLNRVDSLAYTSPFFFHIIRYFFDFM